MVRAAQGHTCLGGSACAGRHPGGISILSGSCLPRFAGTAGAPAYPAPVKGADVAILGKVAVYQIAVMSLMLDRRVRETGYGFLPTWKDWRIGGLHYLYFLPLGIPLALALKVMRWAPGKPLWNIAGTFLGFLFVITLGEEFFFRGGRSSSHSGTPAR